MALQVIDSVTQLQRDLTVAEQGEIRTGLGLGSAATTAASAYANSAQGAKADTAIQPAGLKTINGQSLIGSGDIAVGGGSVSASQITDATAAGRSVLTAADAEAQRAAMGLGTSAVTPATNYATADQGAKADTAIQQAGMASAMIDARQGMTTAQRLEFAGVSDAATQPSAAEFVWWTAPNGDVWNSNGTAWTKVV